MDRKSFDQQLDILLKKAEEKIPNENLPDLPFNRAMRPGGTTLREKAQWYYDYYFKSEMFN